MANMALPPWFIYKSRSWNICKHRYKHFSITGSKNRETGSYKTGNRRRCDVLHDIYQSEVIPDRKVYVYKVLKAFLKNRKYFRSKPEVGTCFFWNNRTRFNEKSYFGRSFVATLNGGYGKLEVLPVKFKSQLNKSYSKVEQMN